ncbi:MAG: glycosyltransferase family 9 protein [Gammaproteobacteria bacterium]
MAQAETEQRLLVVTLSNIGDLVMTTPVFETLAAHFPGLRIDVVADPRSSVLLAPAPYVGTIFHRHKRGGLRAQWQLLSRLRSRRYRAAVDLRTPVIPWLLRCDARATKRARHRREHAVEEHLAVLAELGIDAAAARCRLYVDAAAAADVDAALAVLPAGPWLAVAPGANWPGKRWPPARYAALVERLAPALAGVVLLGSAEDAGLRLETDVRWPPTVDLRGRTALPQAIAALARCRAFVGNDSGLGHAAAALDVPSVTVFGPGRPARYRPWGPRAEIVQAPDADLAALAPGAVAAALEALLGTVATS